MEKLREENKMPSDTFKEDLLANALLGLAMVLFICCKDLCKRVSQSDCLLDSDGLRVKLPTFHGGGSSEEDGTA